MIQTYDFCPHENGSQRIFPQNNLSQEWTASAFTYLGPVYTEVEEPR